MYRYSATSLGSGSNGVYNINCNNGIALVLMHKTSDPTLYSLYLTYCNQGHSFYYVKLGGSSTNFGIAGSNDLGTIISTSGANYNLYGFLFRTL